MSKPCESCDGTGWGIESRDGFRNGIRCGRCLGRGRLPSTAKEQKQWERIIRSELLTSALHPPPTLIVVNVPNQEASA